MATGRKGYRPQEAPDPHNTEGMRHHLWCPGGFFVRWKTEWLPLRFGPHHGLTCAELLFIDPHYFFSVLESCNFLRTQRLQAMEVASRARHILPPKAQPRKWEFVWTLTATGQLERIDIERKKSGSRKRRSTCVRTPRLNLSAVVQRSDHQTAIPIVIDLLKRHYFDKPAQKLGSTDYEAFWEEANHFDLPRAEVTERRYQRELPSKSSGGWRPGLGAITDYDYAQLSPEVKRRAQKKWDRELEKRRQEFWVRRFRYLRYLATFEGVRFKRGMLG